MALGNVLGFSLCVQGLQEHLHVPTKAEMCYSLGVAGDTVLLEMLFFRET